MEIVEKLEAILKEIQGIRRDIRSFIDGARIRMEKAEQSQKETVESLGEVLSQLGIKIPKL